MVQAQEKSELASALLWMGLWPALDAIHRRRLRCFGTPDELVSALAWAFTALVARVDLRRTHHVAAALVRGTERDVLKGGHKVLGEQRLRTRLETLSEADGRESFMEWAEPLASQVASFAAEVEALRAWLLPLVGEDTDLLVSVLLHDEDFTVAGASRGLAPTTARKRVQRALTRLRKMEKEIGQKEFLSQIGARGCL
ncbi:sigma-70 family RNA polymerase sigma factor [Myxococcus sp. K15C18031901]|nr:sigma-70 family RNA polymerase sigma factor [Myxococcus dinghuensis]